MRTTCAADRSKASRKVPGRVPAGRTPRKRSRTLLRWAGDDPGTAKGLAGERARPGCRCAPMRNGSPSYFARIPRDYLKRTFEDGRRLRRDRAAAGRPVRSHCEHHIAPIIGRVHIALHAAQPRGRHLQAVPGWSTSYAQAPAGAGEDDGGDRRLPSTACSSRMAWRSCVEGAHECMTTRGDAQVRRLDGDAAAMLGVFRDKVPETRAGVPVGDQPGAAETDVGG